MSERKIITRKVIFDHPAETDRFPGGGHTRSANALARTIQQFDGRDRAIGLEGKWGSGKSTIVRLAQDELQRQRQKNNYHVFTFDLWSNQTTCFRRAFLESLLSWAEDKFLQNVNFFRERRDIIRDRTIKTKTENHKTVNFYGLLVFIFLLLMPVIYTWISPFALLNDASTDSVPVWTCLSVIVIAAMAFAACATVGFSYRKQGSEGRSFTRALAAALLPFSNESETMRITQNVREEDPTQYEFEIHFRKIVQRIQAGSDRLVIVFDNIDRLPREAIPNAWSDIRSVLVSGGARDYGADESITAILPYDKNHILQAYDVPANLDSDKNTETDGGGGKARFQQEDIFRKSFDAIIHVSPPILSDAWQFFHENFSEALGGRVDDDQARRVYRIFDMHMQKLDEPPTPRQLVAFINSVTAIWEERQGTIPLEAIAVYVVHQELIEANPASLRAANLIDRRYLDQADLLDLNRQLVALAYNVDADHAYQVLLDGPIERVFTVGTSAALEELSQSPGFDEMLYRVFEEKAKEWAETSPRSFAHAASQLAGLKRSSAVKRPSEQLMLHYTPALRSTQLVSLAECKGVLSILSFGEERNAGKIFGALVEWVARSVPEEQGRDFQAGKDWVRFIGEIVCEARKLFSPDTVNELVQEIEIPEGIEFLMGAAYSADEAEVHLRDMKCKVEKSALAERLSTMITDEPKEFDRVWPEVKYSVAGNQVESLLGTLCQHLRSTSHADNIETLRWKLEYFVQVYADADQKDSGRNEILKQLVNDGALYKYAYDAAESGQDASTTKAIQAAALFLITSVHKDAKVPNPAFQKHVFGDIQAEYNGLLNQVNEGADSETIALVADHIIKCGQLSQYIKAAAQGGPTQEFLNQVVVSAIHKDVVVPDIQVVIGQYEYLRELLDVSDLEKLLARIGQHCRQEQWKAIDVEEVPASLVARIQDRDEKRWKELIERIDKWLKETTVDDWRVSLEEDNNRVAILRERVVGSSLEIPSANLRQPLIDHFVNTLTGNISPDGDFDKLVAALPAKTRSTIKQEMLEHLDGKTVNQEGILLGLTCYCDTLSKMPIAKLPSVSIVRLLRPLVEADVDKGCEFIKSRKKDWRSTLRSASETDVGIVRESLEGLQQAPAQETKERAKIIASTIGLDIESADGRSRAEDSKAEE